MQTVPAEDELKVDAGFHLFVLTAPSYSAAPVWIFRPWRFAVARSEHANLVVKDPPDVALRIGIGAAQVFATSDQSHSLPPGGSGIKSITIMVSTSFHALVRPLSFSHDGENKRGGFQVLRFNESSIVNTV
jgi:hypothetical protein